MFSSFSHSVNVAALAMQWTWIVAPPNLPLFLILSTGKFFIYFFIFYFHIKKSILNANECGLRVSQKKKIPCCSFTAFNLLIYAPAPRVIPLSGHSISAARKIHILCKNLKFSLKARLWMESSYKYKSASNHHKLWAFNLPLLLSSISHIIPKLPSTKEIKITPSHASRITD